MTNRKIFWISDKNMYIRKNVHTCNECFIIFCQEYVIWFNAHTGIINVICSTYFKLSPGKISPPPPNNNKEFLKISPKIKKKIWKHVKKHNNQFFKQVYLCFHALNRQTKETSCIPPPHTITEYFPPILFGLISV